ncbi:toll-like receptor 6 [Eurytemora carolleeae]|uniref:toll-like receptor 6 n=1 Tax=Eurytemora carolleeae TaxID=1294199 RepID=UPI000C777A48|nr:toll-like receptor 6 [Eurytemora carolleeae]|eukprot:XP_023342316.1 toll-like receptor 6 [Eurytemora affinis]
MEQSPPILNICVHQRDFKIGVSVIENIVESVENSKMFLLILSNGFLESRWCRFETYVATHLLRDNMDDIVVIMKEVLNLNPDKNISFLIQTKTYLEYSETQEFWNRLKYSICKHKTSKGLPSHPSNPRNQSRLTYQADNPDTSSQLNEYQEVTKL